MPWWIYWLFGAVRSDAIHVWQKSYGDLVAAKDYLQLSIALGVVVAFGLYFDMRKSPRKLRKRGVRFTDNY